MGPWLRRRERSVPDLIGTGIVDPVKVTRNAVNNAVSIAALALTTEALIVDKPEEEDESPGHGHGHATLGTNVFGSGCSARTSGPGRVWNRWRRRRAAPGGCRWAAERCDRLGYKSDTFRRHRTGTVCRLGRDVTVVGE